jgi:hypothetical protein
MGLAPILRPSQGRMLTDYNMSRVDKKRECFWKELNLQPSPSQSDVQSRYTSETFGKRVRHVGAAPTY